MALLALVNNRQELARLQAGQANAAGAVDGSYGFLAEGSGFKKAQFSLAKSEAEYGAFEKFSDRIGGWMQSAAQWMRGHYNLTNRHKPTSRPASSICRRRQRIRRQRRR